MNPSLPAVVTTLLETSFALSRHVTFSFAFLTRPLGSTLSVAGSSKRSESSDEMIASWSSLEYVRGSCCGAVDKIL
jgi:hypothetical protein